MRWLIAVFAVWFAILLVPEGHSGTRYVREKVWLSRTCPDSKWYIDESDDQTVTLVCYNLQEEEPQP